VADFSFERKYFESYSNRNSLVVLISLTKLTYFFMIKTRQQHYNTLTVMIYQHAMLLIKKMQE